MNLFIGNAIMLIASLIMVCVGLMKTRKQILVWQTIQIAMMGVGSVFLGSIPGLIANIVGVVRNLVGYHGKLNRTNQVIICVAAVVSTLVCNNLGMIGLFPIAAAVWYTLGMNTPDIKKLKWLILGTLVLWVIHDFAIHSYVSFTFNMISIMTCLIGILRRDNSHGNSSDTQN